ncbi:MAG: tetratricopeptide repeat protein [Gemmatimonadales bacterium]
MTRLLLVALAAGLTAGCATKGSVRQVETQVLVLRAETARQDSVRAAELARIIRLQQQAIDSLSASRQALRVLEARVGSDLTDVQRQLLQIQELSGQSQRQLGVLKAQLDARAQTPMAMPVDSIRPADSTAVAVPPAASAEQMYVGALQQYQRGSPGVARRAFLEFLQQYPAHPNVPDAMYWVAESFEAELPDTAIARFQELHAKFPQSRRAPTALYKIGYVLETVKKSPVQARAAYQRLVTEYPRSEDADLARARLESLKP